MAAVVPVPTRRPVPVGGGAATATAALALSSVGGQLGPRADQSREGLA